MERILKFLVGLAPSFVLLLVGTAVIKLLLRIINKALERTKLEKTAHPLIKTIARIGLYVLLLLMVASNLGVDVTGLVAVTSVASLVLSLSLQEALTNLIGGFTLLSTRPFVAGDFVEVAEYTINQTTQKHSQ